MSFRKTKMIISIMVAVISISLTACSGDAKKPVSSKNVSDISLAGSSSGSWTESETSTEASETTSEKTETFSSGKSQSNSSISKPATGNNTQSKIFDVKEDKFDVSGRIPNLNGKTIRITEGHRMDTNSSSADGVLNSRNIARIEEKYNCKIKKVPFQPDTTKTSIIAGQPDTDIWNLTNSDFFTSVYNAKMIQPLDDLKCIDFKDYTTFSNMTEYFNIGNKRWAVNPQTYGITSIAVNTVLVGNKKMLASKGVDVNEIFSLQKKGKWTWAEFQKIAKKVTDPAGNKYAIQDSASFLYQSLLASNSTDYILKEGNKLVFNGDSAKAKEVMKFYSDLAADKSLNPVAGSANSISADNSVFMAGKTYFNVQIVACNSPEWNYIKDQANNVAIFNIPKPTEAAEYKSYLTGICPYVIPVYTGKDANWRARAAATIMTELFSPLKSQEDYAKELKTDSMLAAGGDSNSLDTLLNLQSISSFSYSYMGGKVVTAPNENPKSGWLDLIHGIASNPSSYQSVVDSKKNSYNAILKEILNQKS